MLILLKMLAENRHIYRRFIYHLSLFCLCIGLVLSLYDVVFHLLFEGVHLTMEVLEQLLDIVIEHLFHTERRETQIIVFYILLIFGGSMSYIIWKALVMIWQRLSQIISTDILEFKIAVMNDWSLLSRVNKATLISLFIGANYLASMLFF